jgi:hypothetical protein
MLQPDSPLNLTYFSTPPLPPSLTSQHQSIPPSPSTVPHLLDPLTSLTYLFRTIRTLIRTQIEHVKMSHPIPPRSWRSKMYQPDNLEVYLAHKCGCPLHAQNHLTHLIWYHTVSKRTAPSLSSDVSDADVYAEVDDVNCLASQPFLHTFLRIVFFVPYSEGAAASRLRVLHPSREGSSQSLDMKLHPSAFGISTLKSQPSIGIGIEFMLRSASLVGIEQKKQNNYITMPNVQVRLTDPAKKRYRHSFCRNQKTFGRNLTMHAVRPACTTLSPRQYMQCAFSSRITVSTTSHQYFRVLKWQIKYMVQHFMYSPADRNLSYAFSVSVRVSDWTIGKFERGGDAGGPLGILRAWCMMVDWMGVVLVRGE